jgi:membrane protease subunit HflK
MLQDAEGYREQVINNAEGEVNRFLQVLESYRLAPEVTRRRMYIETVQTVLSGSTKIFIDSESSGNLLYLPIDRLLRGNLTLNDQSMTSSNEEPLSQFQQASEQIQDLRSRPLR